MPVGQHWPTSYKRIKELARSHGIQLTRGAVTGDFPKACVITMLGYVNAPTDKKLKYTWASDNRPTTKRFALEAIEDGFESVRVNPPSDSSDEYVEYYNIGRKLSGK